LQTNAEQFWFFKNAIALRRAHPILRGKTHFRNCDYVGSGYADISWHGTRAWNADWSEESRILAFMLCGKHARVADDYLYVALNMHWESQWFELPYLPQGMQWHVAINTAMPAPHDAWESGLEPRLDDQRSFLLADRAVAVLVGK